jgi:hypothetical protein
MRPIAVIGLAVLLSGCAYASNPLDGFSGYVGQTHGLAANPNAPQANSETMQRVRGEEVTVAPLRPQAGNVWPAPVAAEPTLEDYEREQQNGTLPPEPTATPQGSSTAPPPPNTSVAGPARPLTMPPAPVPMTPPPSTLGKAAPVTGDITTPGGVAHVATDPNGVITYSMSNGTKGIAVSNGNGTLTLIGPDGSVQTVNAPK